MSHNVTKGTFGRVCPVKIQISLCIPVVWSESLLGTFWIAKDATFLHADTAGAFESLCYYENMPIQIYRKFHLEKLKIFR